MSIGHLQKKVHTNVKQTHRDLKQARPHEHTPNTRRVLMAYIPPSKKAGASRYILLFKKLESFFQFLAGVLHRLTKF